MDDLAVESSVLDNDRIRIYSGTEGIELDIYLTSGTDPTLISVAVTPSAQIRVTLPSEYASRIRGLCGNYDGAAANDLSTLQGTDVSAEPSEIQGQQIAQSYLINDA